MSAPDPADRIHIVATADGSRTLHHPSYAQTYHSCHGALTETQHVFIGLSGLHERLARGETHVLEVGIGTGLNLLATLSYAQQHRGVVHYTGIERDPPPVDLLRELAFNALDGMDATVWETFLDAVEQRLHFAQLPGGSTLRFHWDDFDNFPFQQTRADIIYHDGFSPEMNPELWSEDALKKLTSTLTPNGALVTYTVQGAVRRALATLGLRVEKLPGPTHGKREVLRATRT